MRPWIELCLLVKKFAFMHESRIKLQIETLWLCDRSVSVCCYFVISMVKYLTCKNSDRAACQPVQDGYHIFTFYWRCCSWLGIISILFLLQMVWPTPFSLCKFCLFLCWVTYRNIISSTCRTLNAIRESLRKIYNVSVWCLACSLDNQVCGCVVWPFTCGRSNIHILH